MDELQRLERENRQLREILESLDIYIYDDNITKVVKPAQKVKKMQGVLEQIYHIAVKIDTLKQARQIARIAEPFVRKELP